jgi:hypothetical protein
MSLIIEGLVNSGELPKDSQIIIDVIGDDKGLFISTEGENWDFKESWPFSYSDSYFHGICRLICAFANTSGGIIIFGVHDRTRKGDCNKVIPNLDRLTQAFRQLTGRDASFDFRRYTSDTHGSFDVLLVKPLDKEELPLRFLRQASGYPPHAMWVRENNEVVSGDPRHIALLYCRTPPDVQVDEPNIEGHLPPSPATIRRFVGRMKTIDSIFQWLKASDQPRTFLYGKGGSGKSTIAFEVARTLKSAGAGFKIEGGDTLESVIFINAKQVELNPETREEIKFRNNDFEDEKTLYEAILTEGRRDLENFDEMSLSDLKKEISVFLDNTSSFIVIDDIDTLTTKGIDAGFDFLFGALCRARKRSKILYTLRNVPTHSLSNSIEVPGLEPGKEYEEFVQLCADQFKVQEPDAGFRNGKLVDISERRPLVVESVLALRRHTDNYSRAAALFEQQSGDDVRSYVFRREWESIAAASRGRDLLAVLSLYGKPIAYDDLLDIMQFDAARIHDAIAAVQEMFLKVESKGESNIYQLSPLTQSFVESAAKQLDIYAMIKTRVQKFKSNIYAEDPALSRLSGRVLKLLRESESSNSVTAAIEAWNMLTGVEHDYSITQDPRYMALCGYAALHQQPPRLAEARTYFESSFAMRYSPDLSFVRAWHNVERDAGMGDQLTSRILKLVTESKGYTEANRIEFASKRAVFLYNLARDNISVEPERSVERLQESLYLHGHAYLFLSQTRDPGLGRGILYMRNTAFYLFQQLQRAGRIDDIIESVRKISSSPRVSLDPIEEPLTTALVQLARINALRAERQRWAGKLVTLSKELQAEGIWVENAVKLRIKDAIEYSAKELRLLAATA